MSIELAPASRLDEPVLERLMQLYAYDWSELIPEQVGEDGRFPIGTSLSRCWEEPWRHTYMLRVENRLAGFAILSERSYFTHDPTVCDVAELFVMRAHRRKGVGLVAAAAAFDLFPRRWEVRQRKANTAATAFWRRAIGEYTGGRYTERVVDDETWSGPVQSFDAR